MRSQGERDGSGARAASRRSRRDDAGTPGTRRATAEHRYTIQTAITITAASSAAPTTWAHRTFLYTPHPSGPYSHAT